MPEKDFIYLIRSLTPQPRQTGIVDSMGGISATLQQATGIALTIFGQIRSWRQFLAFSEFEIKRIQKMVGKYIEKRRPPAHLRDEVDLSFRVKRQSVEIFEIRPLWNNPREKIEEAIAKAAYVKTQNTWKLYWQRADLKWHRYDPDPEVDSIEKFIEIVENDELCCFFG